MANFCFNCGKPLNNGEMCECQRASQPSVSNPWETPASQPFPSNEPTNANQSGFPNDSWFPGQGGSANQGGFPSDSGFPGQGGSANQGGFPSDSGFPGQGSSPAQGGFPGDSGFPGQGGFPAGQGNPYGQSAPQKAPTSYVPQKSAKEQLGGLWEMIKDLWIKFKNHVGIGEPETNNENHYERGKKIVPDCISADDGEIPVRQYVVAKLRTFHKLHWAEGRLQVTNKRVVFRAPGRSIMGKTILQHEFAIDEIAGVEARKEPKFGILEFFVAYCLSFWAGMATTYVSWWLYDKVTVLGIILAFILTVAGIVPPFLLHKKFLLKSTTVGASMGAMTVLVTAMKGNTLSTIMVSVISLLWIICAVLYALKTNLVLTIKTKGASGAVEIRAKKKVGLLSLIFGKDNSGKEEYTGFSNVFPMQDTEKAIREVGAMISDIQKMGDYGIEKWKEENNTTN